MPSSKPEKGVNDLATLFPEVAAEADGWEPSTVIAGSWRRLNWKCKKCNYKWRTSPHERTRKSIDKSPTGCPSCSASGFDPSKQAWWFYLLARQGEQQFGITNHIKERMKYHRSQGWKELKRTGPHDGYEVQETEKRLKKWLKKEIGLVPDKQENWYTSKMEVHSLAELKEKSGIETSIF